MLLIHVVLLSLTAALSLTAIFTFVKHLVPGDVQSRFPHPSLVAAAAASLVIVSLLCLRSLDFGVDTVAYADLFTHYCNGGQLSDAEGSFQAATLLLNGVMLGACNVQLLPSAWIIAIVVPVFALAVPWALKWSYLGVFLMSIIGIELATNALRQGLSVGLMLLVVSILTTCYGPRRWLALPFAVAAVIFHSSAALFLGAYFLARFHWLTFTVVTLGLIWFTVNFQASDITVPLARDFFYEIQKYAAHEDDELWVRILAFACVLAALVAPVLARRPGPWVRFIQPGPYAIALRLSLLCVPFLALPYFGYRFIYGVYPAILFLTLGASTLPGLVALSRAPVQLIWLLGMNVFVLMAWSAGSSYMREVPFL